MKKFILIVVLFYSTTIFAQREYMVVRIDGNYRVVEKKCYSTFVLKQNYLLPKYGEISILRAFYFGIPEVRSTEFWEYRSLGLERRRIVHDTILSCYRGIVDESIPPVSISPWRSNYSIYLYAFVVIFFSFLLLFRIRRSQEKIYYFYLLLIPLSLGIGFILWEEFQEFWVPLLFASFLGLGIECLYTGIKNCIKK